MVDYALPRAGAQEEKGIGQTELPLIRLPPGVFLLLHGSFLSFEVPREMAATRVAIGIPRVAGLKEPWYGLLDARS